MASTLTTSSSSLLRQPPNYILQSWHREQVNIDDQRLLQRTFLVAPDAAIPLSKLRQRFRMIVEERARPRIVIHRDPWDVPNAQRSTNTGRRTSMKELIKSHTRL